MDASADYEYPRVLTVNVPLSDEEITSLRERWDAAHRRYPTKVVSLLNRPRREAHHR